MVSNGTTWIPAAGSVNPPVESLYVHVCNICSGSYSSGKGDIHLYSWPGASPQLIRQLGIISGTGS